MEEILSKKLYLFWGTIQDVLRIKLVGCYFFYNARLRKAKLDSITSILFAFPYRSLKQWLIAKPTLKSLRNSENYNINVNIFFCIMYSLQCSISATNLEFGFVLNLAENDGQENNSAFFMGLFNMCLLSEY